jgi:Xaa-Pro dipeptidase
MSDNFVYQHRTYDPKDIYGQNAVDWENRIDMQALVEKRWKRTQEIMKEENVGAMILWRHEWIRYVCGLWPGMHQVGERMIRYLLVLPNELPIMFETAGVDLECQKLASRLVKDFRPAMVWRAAGPAQEHMLERFINSIMEPLKERGLDKERIGVDMVDSNGYQAMLKAGLQLTDAQNVIMKASQIKFPEEIELMKHACTVQDSAFWVAENMLRPGLREDELKGAVVNELYRLGSERVEQITLASGGRTNPFYRNSSSDKLMRCGDMVLLDICHQYMGYNTCYYRNFVVGGRPTQRQIDLVKGSTEAIFAALDRVKDGATTDYVVQPWKLLYKDSDHGSVSLLQWGHGIGITNHERPWVTLGYSEQYPDVIKENMTMSFETLVGEPGESECGRVEEQIVVTKNGYELLSLYPYSEYFGFSQRDFHKSQYDRF